MICKDHIRVFYFWLSCCTLLMTTMVPAQESARGVIVTPPPQCTSVPPPSAQAFDLNVPAFNAHLLGRRIFEWQQLDGSNIQYRLRISANSTFTDIRLDSDTGNPNNISVLDSAASAIVNTFALPEGVYYWQVSASTGELSRISCFQSDTPPGTTPTVSANIGITGTIFETIDNRLNIIAALADIDIEASNSNSSPVNLDIDDAAYMPGSSFLCQDSPVPNGGQPVKLCSNSDGRYFIYFLRPDPNSTDLPNNCNPATNNGRILAAKGAASGQRGLCLTDNTPSFTESFDVIIVDGNNLFEDGFE